MYLFLCGLITTSHAADTPPTISGQAGAARVWCHLCPWNALNNLSHSRRDFPLGLGMEIQPGMTPRTETQYLCDFIYECMTAADAGMDAFALDIIVGQPLQNWLWNVDGYLKAAETVTTETGRAFFVAPCLDSPGARSPEDLAVYIAEMLTDRVSSPAWPKIDGRPVIWTFGGTDMSADRWRNLVELLKAKNLEPVFILDANSFFAKVQPQVAGQEIESGLPVEELDIYASLPVAFYAFRTDFDRHTMERCLAYLQEKHPNSLAAKLSIGTVWPGYWSLGSGWYVDPQATGLIRDTFKQSTSSQWLTVTTWNDFYETTHFQPSIGFSTGRIDLLHALLNRWKGDATWPVEPRIYLWQPNEIQVDEAIKAEVFSLLPDKNFGPVQARVSLCDASGVISQAGKWQTLTGDEIRVTSFEIMPVKAAPKTCQYLWLEMQLPNEPLKSCLSQPILIWPAGYHPLATKRGTLWQMGAQEKGPQSFQMTQTNGLPVRLETSWDAGKIPSGSRLHVRQNFNLIHFPGETVGPVIYDMEATYGEGRAPWEVYPPVPNGLRWGFFDTVIVLPDGDLRWSEPVWVDPVGEVNLQCAGLWQFDDGAGQQANDSSPYGHHASLQGDPKWEIPGKTGSNCLRFDGVDDCLNVPGGRFPEGDFTVSAWIKPDVLTTPKQQCIYVDINACILFAVNEKNHLSCARAYEGGWAEAVSEIEIPVDRWTHVTVTYDQQNLRLYVNGEPDGIAPCTGTRASNLTAIGCNPFGNRGSFFAGCIDEVMVTARALGANEIQ